MHTIFDTPFFSIRYQFDNVRKGLYTRPEEFFAEISWEGGSFEGQIPHPGPLQRAGTESDRIITVNLISSYKQEKAPKPAYRILELFCRLAKPQNNYLIIV